MIKTYVLYSYFLFFWGGLWLFISFFLSFLYVDVNCFLSLIPDIVLVNFFVFFFTRC